MIDKYKIKSIEDPFAENDWQAWTKLMKQNRKDVQIVGDDLYVTNLERLKMAFKFILKCDINQIKSNRYCYRNIRGN